MKKAYIFFIAIFIVLSFAIQNQTFAQNNTFAFKLNGHKHNQGRDLMMRAIQEQFWVAMDSLDLPALLDTLAMLNGLDSINVQLPETVNVSYAIDDSANYDFLTNITLDTLKIFAVGLGCEFNADIVGAGFVLGGVSNYTDGEFKITIGEAETIQPEITVVGTGHILCPGIAGTFKTAMVGEIDSLLTGLAMMFDSGSYNDLLRFVNPIVD